VWASAPKAAHPAVAVGHQAHQTGAQRGVRRQHGEGAQRLAPQQVAGRGQQRRGRGRRPRLAEEGERAQRLHGHRLVSVANQAQQQLRRGRVLERTQTAGGQRSRARVVRGRRGQQHRSQQRALQAHRRPGGRPPVEAGSAVGDERPLRGRQVPETHQCEQLGSWLGPGIGGASGVVAADGHDPARLRQRVEQGLGDRRGGARVSQPSQGLGGAPAHAGVGVLQRPEKTVDRRGVAEQPQGEGGDPPDLRLRIGDERQQRRDQPAVADAPGGERGTAAHPAVGVNEQRLKLARAARPRVLELQQTREPLDARRRSGRPARGGAGRRQRHPEREQQQRREQARAAGSGAAHRAIIA